MAVLNTKYYLSLDIESCGPRYNNTVESIGIYWAPVDPLATGLRIKRRWCLQPLPGDQEDPATMTEFWSATHTHCLSRVRAQEQVPRYSPDDPRRSATHSRCDDGVS